MTLPAPPGVRCPFMPDGSDDRCTLTSTGHGGALSVPSLVVGVTSPGGGAAVEAPLDLRPLVVGTSPECDLVLADPKVSRRHCEIRLTPEGVVVRDLGSKNGTLAGKVAIREGCGSILCPTEIDRGTKTAECPRFCAERTWALA